MPPRTSLFESSARDFICRSCLSNLRNQSRTAQWPARYSSTRSLQGRVFAPAPSSRLSPEQDAERLKTLETLGLLQNDKKVAINYFEQGKGGKLRRLHDQDEFGESVVDPGGQADSGLEELDQALEQAAKLAKIMEGPGGKEKTENLRDQQALEQSLTGDVEQTERPNVAITTHGWTREQHRHIIRLNHILIDLDKKVRRTDLQEGKVNSLWKYYCKARPSLFTRWDAVSLYTWNKLWEILAADNDRNPHRMSHIHVLANDMQAAGVVLTDGQRLLVIEAMFVDGSREMAIENHRKSVSTLGDKPETFLEFWQLGLRMSCLARDLDRAERIINIISDSPLEKDPRFVLPFIQACAADSTTAEKAHSTYRHLRETLREQMTIMDYDEIISYFLVSCQTEYALYVFVDMMKGGETNLHGTSRLPPTIGNAFFFGKWLKRLIGSGDLDGAYSVLQLMHKKCLTPSPIHVNGLVGAWFRSGTADNVQQAEEVAWTMINTRLQFVENRRRFSETGDQQVQLQTGAGWAKATLETFCLVAENYRNRGKHGKMEELWRAFRTAEIGPDSFMMNQLLFSYLKNGLGKDVADVYHGLALEYKVQPDAHTFMALWQALPVNRLGRLPFPVRSKQHGEHISKARTLFGEMLGHVAVFGEDGVHIDLASKILHSFRLLKDDVGLLLAWRALRQVFRFEPPELLVVELLAGTTNLQRTARGSTGHRLMTVRRRIDHYLEFRQRELVKAGELGKDEELPVDVKRAEANNFVELDLETKITTANREEPQQLLTQAAREMGFLPDEDATKQISD